MYLKGSCKAVTLTVPWPLFFLLIQIAKLAHQGNLGPAPTNVGELLRHLNSKDAHAEASGWRKGEYMSGQWYWRGEPEEDSEPTESPEDIFMKALQEKLQAEFSQAVHGSNVPAAPSSAKSGTTVENSVFGRTNLTSDAGLPKARSDDALSLQSRLFQGTQADSGADIDDGGERVPIQQQVLTRPIANAVTRPRGLSIQDILHVPPPDFQAGAGATAGPNAQIVPAERQAFTHSVASCQLEQPVPRRRSSSCEAALLLGWR